MTQTTFPPEPPQPELPERPPMRVLRPVLAVVAVSALAVASAGVGYAARGGTTSASAHPGATSGSAQQGAPGEGLAQQPGTGSGSLPEGGSGSAPSGGWSAQQQDPSTTSLDAEAATDAQESGLVRIVSTVEYDQGKAVGTGLVLSGSGEVVTNHHVVEGATRIRVTMVSTGKTYAARVVGADSTDDLAVLQLRNASGLTTVTTSSTSVSVGEAVTGVGDAGGAADTLTASPGTVVALRRPVTTRTEEGTVSERLKGLIEVDADIVSGDSGGALVDSSGAVVGMDAAASSGSTNITGYAIPIAKVLRIAGQVESGTQSARVHLGYDAFLGVELGGSTPTLAGVVDGSPAAASALASGDTVTSVGGVRVSTAAGLRRVVGTHQPGDRVSVTWTDTAGQAKTASVVLTTGPVA